MLKETAGTSIIIAIKSCTFCEDHFFLHLYPIILLSEEEASPLSKVGCYIVQPVKDKEFF